MSDERDTTRLGQTSLCEVCGLEPATIRQLAGDQYDFSTNRRLCLRCYLAPADQVRRADNGIGPSATAKGERP